MRKKPFCGGVGVVNWTTSLELAMGVVERGSFNCHAAFPSHFASSSQLPIARLGEYTRV